MIMFYISYGASHVKGAAAFRIPWGVQMTPAIILFLGLYLLPESPRWLAKNNRWEESLGVLILLHHGNDDEFVQREMSEIRKSVEFDAKNDDVSIGELFHPKMLNRLHVGLFTQIWSQLTGMNV